MTLPVSNVLKGVASWFLVFGLLVNQIFFHHSISHIFVLVRFLLVLITKIYFFACCIISSQTWTAYAHESGKTTLLSTSAPSSMECWLKLDVAKGSNGRSQHVTQHRTVRLQKCCKVYSPKNYKKNFLERYCSGNIFSLICPNMWPMWAMFTP